MRWPALILATALGCLSGCSGIVVEMTRTRAPPRPMTPRPREEVELLGVGPRRPYTEVGVITFTASRGPLAPARQYADDVAYAIWSYAGRVGCDAVVLAGERGSCLVYDDSAPPGAPRSPPPATGAPTP